MSKWIVILNLAAWQVCVFPRVFGQDLPADRTPSSLEIRSVTASDRSIPLRRKEVNLGPFPERISFSFGPDTNSSQSPIRIRYRLEGYENNWRDGPADMILSARFFNAAGDQIGQNIFRVNGESAGWNGSLKTSPLTHRREVVVVPPQASRLWVVISSAGPPESVGVYVVANLTVSKRSDNSPPVLLMESPLDHQLDDETNRVPVGWMRDGTHSSMARIVTFGQDPVQKAFAILDDDGGSHAEWRNLMESAPTVNPGDHILIEWNEMFSIGVGNIRAAHYQNLPQGNYQFHVAGFDICGNPTGAEDSVRVLVPPPFWRTSWFWSVVVTSSLAIVLGGGRYLAWHKMRREMLRLKNQQALEKERLRIARDIHDDLGARITEIALASALAKKKSPLPETASADFDHISNMSRDLISALYETVWAVNPENDNLDALGNYLCQMINQLCEHAQLPCRLQISDLPSTIQVSSQIRHNIILAAKEAVHNVIKHAKASEMTLHVAFEEETLLICIQDNGRGFDATAGPTGNGLVNMKCRLTDIGGTCSFKSRTDGGTSVEMRLPFQAANNVH